MKEKQKLKVLFTKPIANNVLPHCDDFEENRYTKEENKLVRETHKILDPTYSCCNVCKSSGTKWTF